MKNRPNAPAASTQNHGFTRREIMRGLIAMLAPGVYVTKPYSAQQPTATSEVPQVGPYDSAILPRGVRSRFINNGNGLKMHILEAGFDVAGRPCVVLLHGFPELAYSWRKVIPVLAEAGFHVVAPDLRGYGRTSGGGLRYEDDTTDFLFLNEVRDILGLIFAVGYRSVDAVIGHDWGSPIAAWCALIRPDVFRSVVMMSGPFAGPPVLQTNTPEATTGAPTAITASDPIYEDLAKLTPPRKHYQRYYATREANDNMWHAPQGIHAFLRAYYHMKSADWKQNKPVPLKAWTAAEVAQMPRYYVMDLNKGMAETVAAEMPSAAEIAACKWLPESDLRVYSGEYGRTGFQGGLQGYRARWTQGYTSELLTFSGRTIDVPSLFIGGKSDWGVHQRAGAFETMQKTACTRMLGVHLVDGAGHWVQQEQTNEVNRLLLQFLRLAVRR
jgi:pimeloyl-ACP methyl ester carboxylesterase